MRGNVDPTRARSDERRTPRRSAAFRRARCSSSRAASSATSRVRLCTRRGSRRPAATASRTAQPGSPSCLQSRNRQCSATSNTSWKARSMPSPLAHRLTARRPGVSISQPPAGRPISSAAVVVWRPRSSPSRTSPVPCTCRPTRALTNVDLPTPLAPSSAIVRRAVRELGELVEPRTCPAADRVDRDGQGHLLDGSHDAVQVVGPDQPWSARSPAPRRCRRPGPARAPVAARSAPPSACGRGTRRRCWRPAAAPPRGPLRKRPGGRRRFGGAVRAPPAHRQRS